MAAFSSLGLAMYAGLILTICLSSCGCGVLTLNTALLNISTPKELIGAVELEPWRLSELERYGVLVPGDDLLLYHDHTSMGNGQSGCLVLAPEDAPTLVRWDDTVETGRVPVAGAVVENTEEEVVVTLGETAVRCPFGDDEGGDRFARMLRASAE